MINEKQDAAIRSSFPVLRDSFLMLQIVQSSLPPDSVIVTHIDNCELINND